MTTSPPCSTRSTTGSAPATCSAPRSWCGVWRTPRRCGDPIGINCLNLVLPNVKDSQMHIFNRSGHYPFREHPEQFNAVIKSFIAANSE